uniref:Uncharacterized protein n=1 Tax=Fagus sylvatica TaxID=28930 RepID=A0A2N9G6L9_FAGSY
MVQHQRRLADLEVVSRWCSFAVVRGLRNKLRGGAGLRRFEPRSRGGAGLRRFVDRFLSLAVEIYWSVVAGGGVLLKLWLGFVGLWWVLQWVKMWLRWLCCCEWWLAVLAGGCGRVSIDTVKNKPNFSRACAVTKKLEDLMNWLTKKEAKATISMAEVQQAAITISAHSMWCTPPFLASSAGASAGSTASSPTA